MNIKNIIPGVVACIFITIIARLLSLFVPNIGAASIAIFLGILLGNTILKSKTLLSGTKFCEKDLLSVSIVLMGGTLNVYSILNIGFSGIFFIVIQMICTIAIAIYLGKLFNFNNKFIMLMGAGNAVCGSSAIAATAPVIDAKEEDRGIAITIVNLVGTILMFLLPFLGEVLYSSDLIKSSAMIGGVLQSVGQVLASAAFLGEDFINLSTIFKILRIILLVVVVTLFSKLNSHYEKKEEATDKHNEDKKVNITIPWFIVGFFILSIINTFGVIPESIEGALKGVSGNLEIIALAAIGMNVRFEELVKQGPKALSFGLLISIFQIIFAITFIAILL